MKNIDMLKKAMRKDQTDRAIYAFKIYNDDEMCTLMELVSELISEVCGIELEFWSILDFVDWCNKELYMMSNFIYNALNTFNEGDCKYITRTDNKVFIHIYDELDLCNLCGDFVVLTNMGFKLEQFNFLEEGRTYTIEELLQNSNKKKCGN